MILLKELLEVLSGPDELLIVRDSEREADQKILYKGYKGMLPYGEIPPNLMEETVKRFSFHPEINHRQWRERNLMTPIDPDKTPNFLYKELQMSIYYKITLEGGKEHGKSNADSDKRGN